VYRSNKHPDQNDLPEGRVFPPEQLTLAGEIFHILSQDLSISGTDYELRRILARTIIKSFDISADRGALVIMVGNFMRAKMRVHGSGLTTH
jgi:hypothetical protein